MEPTRGLKDMRKLRDTTQKELGELVDVSGDTISKVERGERVLKPELANKLAEVFELDPLELRVMNALSIAKDRYEEIKYELEETRKYYQPGKAEGYLTDIWYELSLLTADAASHRVRGGYKKKTGNQLNELYEVGFKFAKLLDDNSEKLLSIAGQADEQPPFG